MNRIEYFRIPHPFDSNSDTIVSGFLTWMHSVAGLPHPEEEDGGRRVRVSRRIVIQRDAGEGDTLTLLGEAEARLRRMALNSYRRATYHTWYEAAKGILVGYVIWLSFSQAPWFWDPINRFVTAVFNGMIDALFRWAIILSYPIRTFIRLFVRRVAEGKANDHLRARIEDFSRIVTKLRRHRYAYAARGIGRAMAAAKSERAKSLIERFASSVESLQAATIDAEVFDSRTASLLRSLSQEAEAGNVSTGLLRELERIRQDMVRLAGAAFRTAPVEIVSPATTVRPSETFEAASDIIAAEGLVAKARNLAKFIDESSALRQEVLRCYRETMRYPTSVNFGRLAPSLEKLRNMARDCHLGDLPTVRTEKGESLAEVYHALYVAAWRASTSTLSRVPILRSFARAEFLRIADSLVGPAPSSPKRTLVECALRTKNRGAIELAKVVAVAFLILGVLNLYILGPTEIAVTTGISFGARDPDTGNYAYLVSKVNTVDSKASGVTVFGKRVLWHIPGTNVIKLDTAKSYTVPVYVVLRQGPPQGFWGSLMGWLAGKNWGEEYSGLVFNVTFTPTKNFAAYHYDGKGIARFSRDAQQLIERWRSETISTVLKEGNPLYDPKNTSETNIVFGPYLKMLGKSGFLENYVSTILGQASFQRSYAGTGFERVEEVARTTLAMIEEAKRNLEGDETLEEDAKKARLEELDMMKQFVLETSRRWAKENAEELGALRMQPNKLRKMLRDPLGHIAELQRHEGLWGALQSYTIFAYLEDKLTRALVNPSTHPDLQKQLIAELMETLNADPTLSQLAKVSAITVSTFKMNIIKYQTNIVVPEQNL